MPEYITREEQEAIISRIDAEDSRQNHRLDKLEGAIENLSKLTISVEKLAVNMDRMVREQEKTANRLTALEQEPADNWRKAVWVILTALIGAAIGYFLH
ncbi:MAG: hypothetical protein IKE03_06160 [Blautia sp.]|nr:hypothetical protein [Blautia sp.]